MFCATKMTFKCAPGNKLAQGAATFLPGFHEHISAMNQLTTGRQRQRTQPERCSDCSRATGFQKNIWSCTMPNTTMYVVISNFIRLTFTSLPF